jgi:hypothetical protein
VTPPRPSQPAPVGIATLFAGAHACWFPDHLPPITRSSNVHRGRRHPASRVVAGCPRYIRGDYEERPDLSAAELAALRYRHRERKER